MTTWRFFLPALFAIAPSAMAQTAAPPACPAILQHQFARLQVVAAFSSQVTTDSNSVVTAIEKALKQSL